MLKWILIVVAVIVAIPILMAVIGLFLPKGHVATSRARFAQKPEALWAALSEFSQWPQWNPAVQSIERAPDREGKPVWVSRGKWGVMPAIVEALEPPRKMVTRIPEDANLGFSGSWTYEIAPGENGSTSTVSITERGEVANPIFRFMSRFFFDAHATSRAFLEALGSRFGESVKPERA
ncbi:MAG: SRPBCC family protein [Planctomycetes bacterium]|nr:SRPBCC family protein [Planctomycetota bacterium]